MFRPVLQIWDCRTLLHNSANHLIQISRVRNDNYGREIVRIYLVLTILFRTFPKALPLGQSMLPLRGGDPAGIITLLDKDSPFSKILAHSAFWRLV